MTKKKMKTARMVTTQDFPTLGPPSLLQFDSFLPRATCKVDQPYLLTFCGLSKKGGGSSSALPVAVISESFW